MTTLRWFGDEPTETVIKATHTELQEVIELLRNTNAHLDKVVEELEQLNRRTRR